jgi:hypothetical protein
MRQLSRALWLSHERQQRQVTSALDRQRQLALMLGTRSSLPPRADFSTIGQKTPQHI